MAACSELAPRRATSGTGRRMNSAGQVWLSSMAAMVTPTVSRQAQGVGADELVRLVFRS
jgi:hypothetical protein